MSKVAVIGIDGGLNGAFVAIDENYSLIEHWDMPTHLVDKKTTKRDFDVRAIASELKQIHHRLTQEGYRVWYFLEKAFPMAKQGLSSTFKTGRCFGLIEGALAAMEVSYEVVPSRTWSKTVLAGMTGSDTKSKSLRKASQLFPKLPLVKPRGTKQTLDGRSDAALIAFYGLKHLHG